MDEVARYNNHKIHLKVKNTPDGVRFIKYHEFPIITLCGSVRFADKIEEVHRELTKDGYLVFTVVPLKPNEEATPEELELWARIHRGKIAISDAICVVNVDGYIGESTQSEIEFAEMMQVPVNYVEAPTKESTNG